MKSHARDQAGGIDVPPADLRLSGSVSCDLSVIKSEFVKKKVDIPVA